jgi:glycosyltransferase involved in cell wall biosynthesis
MLSNQFSHHKNHDTVFEAVRILKELGISVRVVCTGSTYGFRGDDYFLRLQEFIQTHGLASNIHILGMLPRGEQLALTRRSIAMLQPSAFEGWSTVIEDAKTLGKIVLASGIDVHREQLPRTHPYFLDTYDPAAWACAMRDMWNAGRIGPDMPEEERALEEAKIRGMATGRSFLSAMREAMDVQHQS